MFHGLTPVQIVYKNWNYFAVTTLLSSEVIVITVRRLELEGALVEACDDTQCITCGHVTNVVPGDWSIVDCGGVIAHSITIPSPVRHQLSVCEIRVEGLLVEVSAHVHPPEGMLTYVVFHSFVFI